MSGLRPSIKILVSAILIFAGGVGISVRVPSSAGAAGGGWRQSYSDPMTAFRAISCASATVCEAVGTNQPTNSNLSAAVIIGTTDGGSTWTTQTVPDSGEGFPVLSLTDVSCASTLVCEAVGNSGNGTYGEDVILGTTDGGDTWDALPTPAVDITQESISFGAISCASITSCEVVASISNFEDGDGVFFGFLGTTNGGATWTEQPGPASGDLAPVNINGFLRPSWTVMDISCSSPSTCEASGTGAVPGGGLMLNSTDGGSTWTQQNVPDNNGAPIVSVSCVSTTSVCEASGEDWFLGTSDGGSTWVTQSNPEADIYFPGPISCASTTTCEAIGQEFSQAQATILSTTNGGSSWTNQGFGPIMTMGNAIACGSTNSCFATAAGGVIASGPGLIAPIITSAASYDMPTGGQPGFTVSASGFPAPTFSDPGPLDGLSIDPTSGVLSGIPTAAGIFTSTITASNGISPDDAQSFTLIVTSFQIATTALPDASPGTPYGPVALAPGNVGNSAPGYSTSLKWAKSCALPKGMKLSSMGVLSGTPKKTLTAGPSQVCVKVTETVTTLNGRKKVKTKSTAQSTIPLTIS